MGWADHGPTGPSHAQRTASDAPTGPSCARRTASRPPPDGPTDTWTKRLLLLNLNSSELGFYHSTLKTPHITQALHSPCFACRSCSLAALGNLQEGRGREWGGGWGDSPHALGLAQAACPGQMAALPGTVLPVRLPRALALLLVLLLVVVELLDAVLVADLQYETEGRPVSAITCTPGSGLPLSLWHSAWRRHHSHSTEEETEAWRGRMTC